ncbi:MAG: hypothetical protein ABI068_11490 [Ktedonobacterales bacterium]
MRRQSLLIVCVLCLSLTACAGLPFTITAPPHFPPTVTSVHIQRTQTAPRHNWPPLDQTIRNTQQAQQLYDATQSLP